MENDRTISKPSDSSDPDEELRKQLQHLINSEVIEYCGRAVDLFVELPHLEDRFNASDTELKDSFYKSLHGYWDVLKNCSAALGIGQDKVHKWTQAIASVIYPALLKKANAWNVFQRYIKEQYWLWKKQKDCLLQTSSTNTESPLGFLSSSDNLTSPPATPQTQRIVMMGDMIPDTTTWSAFTKAKWHEVQNDVDACAEWDRIYPELEARHPKTSGLARRNDNRFVKKVMEGADKLEHRNWAIHLQIVDLPAMQNGTHGSSGEVVSGIGADFAALREKAGVGATAFNMHCAAKAKISELSTMETSFSTKSINSRLIGLASVNQPLVSRTTDIPITDDLATLAAVSLNNLNIIATQGSGAQKTQRRASDHERLQMRNQFRHVINEAATKIQAAQGKKFIKFSKLPAGVSFDAVLRERGDCALYIRKSLRSTILRQDLINPSKKLTRAESGPWCRAALQAIKDGGIIVSQHNPNHAIYNGPKNDVNTGGGQS